MALTPKQSKALALIASAVTEAVKVAGPLGAPGGLLYAALMAHGCTLDQIKILMDALVHTGRIVKRGENYRLARS